MKIDFKNFNKNNLKDTEEYLLYMIESNVIPDAAEPSTLDYMRFARCLEVHYINKHDDRAATQLWRKIYKSIKKSEIKLKYNIYKGHILVNWALSSLVSECNLDKIVDLLEQANKQDKIFYRNPTHRPSYKILSFLQPLLMFRNKLWPSKLECRKKIAKRLFVVLSFNRSSLAIAWPNSFFQTQISQCIKNDEHLKSLLLQTIDEIELLVNGPEALDRNRVPLFRKSIIFLIAHLLEAILLNISENLQSYKTENSKTSLIIRLIKSLFNKKQIDISKQNIAGLAKYLRKEGVLSDDKEYECRFIQKYRDYIHPNRLRHHKYRLDSNFEKMFFMLFILLLEDLQRVSVSPPVV